MEDRLVGLEKLGLEGAALGIAQAGLFASEELYADAAESYRHALVLAPSPELHVTLADIYLVVGLHQRAETHYREALVGGVPPGVEAAATFGLGRLEYARGRFHKAAAVFRQAREKYAALALTEEEAAARQAEEVAASRAESKH
jgi:tetratricopeptide (TPR) repeat protein